MKKKRPNTKIIYLDTKEKIVAALIKAGNRLAEIDERRWSPCVSADVLEWRELAKAYKAFSK